MGSEQYSDLVLYRRGAGLLLNPYSPVSEELANNDGIYLKYPYIGPFWDLFRWGGYGSENKFPFISNERISSASAPQLLVAVTGILFFIDRAKLTGP